MPSTKPGYTQHDAGVLVNGKLSKTAEDKFIEDLQREIQFGSIGVPSLFPCLPQLNPIGFAGIDLRDRDKYAELYSQGLRNYEAIANALDIKGGHPFFPIIFDPIAFAISLGIDVPKVNFPIDFLIPFPDFILPDFVLKYGLSLNPPIPPPIPSINLPNFDIDISLPDLKIFYSWYLKLPDLFLNICLKIPEIAIKLFSFDFSPICETVRDAELFGKADPSQLTRIAINKVLINKTAECLVIAATGAMLGSASEGVVGKLGEKFEVKDPENPPTKSSDTILAVAGIEKTTPTFRRRLVQISKNLDIPVDWIAAVISLESAKTFSASVRNNQSGAVGLIQFLKSTAVNLGTSIEALVSMTAEEQLTYVEKYYQQATANGKIKLKTIEDTYLAVFYGSAVGIAPSAVVIDKASNELGYIWNSAYDKNSDDKITKAEISGTINGVIFAANKKRISVDDGTISLHDTNLLIWVIRLRVLGVLFRSTKNKKLNQLFQFHMELLLLFVRVLMKFLLLIKR